ncbi:hypothetical protein [Parasphingorhabdus halotolerans]|nr:hypothetical protein [Parasphingorhabdus halotolerans]
MSKRLMFSAVLATILMASTTAYVETSADHNETASAFESANG